jgi:hypothetical protein
MVCLTQEFDWAKLLHTIKPTVYTTNATIHTIGRGQGCNPQK